MGWRERAACTDVDPELFFPLTASGPSQFQTAQALAVCAGCTEREECLEWSLDQEIQHGVWGGLSEPEREVLLRQRRLSVTAAAG